MDYQTKITVDAAKAIKDLDRLSKSLNSNDKYMNALNKSSNALNSTLKKNTGTLSKLTTQTKYLNNSIKKTSANTKLLNTQVKILTTATKNNTAAVKKLVTNTKMLNTSVKNSMKTMKLLSTSMKANNVALKSNSSELIKVTKIMSALSVVVSKSASSMTKLASQTRFLSANIKRNSANIVKLRNVMTTLSEATNKSAIALRTFNSNSLILNASLEKNNIALNKLTKEMMLLGASVNANTAAMAKYSKTTVVASSSQALLGKRMSLANTFLRSQLILFRLVMLASTAYIGLKLYVEFEKTAQSVDLMNKKISQFSGSIHAFSIVQASAFETGIAIDDLSKIITRLAVTTKGAFSTKTLLKWTKGLVVTSRAVGTTTMEMNNAMIQLSQSFSSGFLMGDEFRSISENLPMFKLALRDAADAAGYANQSLKTLSSGRKIDVKLLTEALDLLSKKSKAYIWALNTIEASIERVKVSWAAWANYVGDSKKIKDTFNYLAGLLGYLANNGAIMNQFAKQFPEMAKDVEELTLSLYDLYDTSKLNLKLWMELTKTDFLSTIIEGWSLLIPYIYDFFQRLPITVRTSLDLMSAMWTLTIDTWSALIGKFESYFERVFGLIKVNASLVMDSILSIINSIWKDLISTFTGTLDTMANVFQKFDLTKTAGKAYESLSSSLKNMVGKEKSLIDIYKEHKILADDINKKNDIRQKQLSNQIKLSNVKYKKEVISINKRDELLNKSFSEEVRKNKLIRKSEMEAAKALARFKKKKEDEKVDKGLGGRNLIDPNLQNEIKKAKKAALDYYNVQKDINKEIDKIKNHFSTAYDASSELKTLQEQNIKLKKIRDANQISESDYNKALEKTKKDTEELIALKQEEKLKEIARGYDEVENATYNLSKVQSELNDLLKAGVISEYAYSKSIYASTRALDLARAKAGDMPEGEQFFKGINDGLHDFANNNKTVFEQMSELTTKSFNSMTDELTEFVTTGKADFKGLVDSIIKDLTRIAIQKSITEPLANSLFGSGGSGGLFSSIGNLFGGASIASTSNAFSFAGMSSLIGSANGNVFNNGEHLTAYANGGIVSSPTIFPMANGAGLMGEAGPEAIMPLSRDSSGKLGIKSNNKSETINITINVQGTNGNPEAVRRSAAQVAQAAGNATKRAMRRNG